MVQNGGAMTPKVYSNSVRFLLRGLAFAAQMPMAWPRTNPSEEVQCLPPRRLLPPERIYNYTSEILLSIYILM